MEIRVPVRAAGLDQENLDRWILGEPVRQHAAGGSGSCDDIVVHSSSPGLRSVFRQLNPAPFVMTAESKFDDVDDVARFPGRHRQRSLGFNGVADIAIEVDIPARTRRYGSRL